jgi:hypothetical protein
MLRARLRHMPSALEALAALEDEGVTDLLEELKARQPSEIYGAQSDDRARAVEEPPEFKAQDWPFAEVIEEVRVGAVRQQALLLHKGWLYLIEHKPQGVHDSTGRQHGYVVRKRPVLRQGAGVARGFLHAILVAIFASAVTCSILLPKVKGLNERGNNTIADGFTLTRSNLSSTLTNSLKEVTVSIANSVRTESQGVVASVVSNMDSRIPQVIKQELNTALHSEQFIQQLAVELSSDANLGGKVKASLRNLAVPEQKVLDSALPGQKPGTRPQVH